MKFLFYVGHPHHYHVLRAAADELVSRRHEVRFLARHKDVLLDLLADQPHEVVVVSRRELRSRVLGRAAAILNREYRVLRECLRWKPDLLAGTDLVITHAAKLVRRPSIVVNEDDLAVVPLMGLLAFRFADRIVAPESCNLGRYSDRKVAYRGFQELAYLRPDRFRPDTALLEAHGLEARRFALLRLARLSAHHDFGKRGIDDDLARAIIARLAPEVPVRISSERPLPDDLAALRLAIDPREIHHFLGTARMLVADSQTMTIEAAVLGTPAVRYNDFVGEIGCMNELEQQHRLAVGVRPPDTQRLLDTVAMLATRSDLEEEWARRQAAMLERTDDVTAVLVETFLRHATGEL